MQHLILLVCLWTAAAEDVPFQFPDDWTVDTDESFQLSKAQMWVEPFESQLKRYIFEAEPVDAVRTLDLHSWFCATFCSEKEAWSRHKLAFQLAKLRVMADLESRGFSVQNVDTKVTQWATFFGDFLIISAKKTLTASDRSSIMQAGFGFLGQRIEYKE
jgi:hypothetical protein